MLGNILFPTQHGKDDLTEKIKKDPEQHDLLCDYRSEKIIKLARDLNISPAIIAGRIRYKLDNYKVLSNLIGNKCVRALF